MAWLALWARLASSAPAEGPEALLAELELPSGVRVEGQIQGERWRFVVTSTRTRTLEVAIPSTEEEREAVLALLESLLLDLSLPAPPPAPAPAPEPAPVRTESASSSQGPVRVAPEPEPTLELLTLEDMIALRRSLLSEPAPPRPSGPPKAPLRTSSAAPAPAPRAPASSAATGPALPPPLPSEPPRHERARPALPRLVPWLSLGGAARPGLMPSPGLAAGASLPVGAAFGLGLGASWHPQRQIAVARRASFAQAALDLELLVQTRPWARLWGSAGLVVRDYVQYEERVRTSLTPRSSAGVGVTLPLWAHTALLGGALDLDLARILLEDGEDSVRLFPIDLRFLVRMEFGGRGRTASTDPNIGGAGVRENSALQDHREH